MSATAAFAGAVRRPRRVPLAWRADDVALAALALFGARHWATIVVPAAQGRLAAMVATGLLGGLLCSRLAPAAGIAALAASLAAVLLAAGVPLADLRPDRWGALASGIGGGLGALPALRIPYRGYDPWVQSVLLTGGGLLVLAAALLGFARSPARIAAAVVLGTLYAVPIVEHGPAHPYADGALFALLLAAFLWAGRLESRDGAVAAALAVLAVLAAALAAPHLDARRPWVDYESLAESLQSGRSMTFRWNHSYGPLHWSRDGLELARVRSRGDLYLKAAALEDFDGTAWRQQHGVVRDADTEVDPRHPGWRQTIHVTIKGLRTTEFLGAGTTFAISHATKLVGPATPGTFRATARPLRRGDDYDASVYVPRPSVAQMQRAGTDYPAFVMRQLTMGLPSPPGAVGPQQIAFPPWGTTPGGLERGPEAYPMLDPWAVLRASPYARDFALARRLAAASRTPYAFVRRVIARVQQGARYTERPPAYRGAAPLDAFLFRDHAGYCQQFAGATALLLRMGGVPARVAAGFAPGEHAGRDQLIRDLDAHSWVEVYFPRIGWVTFDPTPSDSPARSQLTDTIRVRATLPGDRPAAGGAGDRASDPRAGGAAGAGAGRGDGGGLPGAALAGVGAAVLALGAAGGAMGWRRRRRLLEASGDPELEELRLALARSGRAPAAEMTLQRLERSFAGSEAAVGYVRALRAARYGSGGAPPTAAQRAALRRELAAGLGVTGRLRALRALPPRPRELVRALRPRRGRAYTP